MKSKSKEKVNYRALARELERSASHIWRVMHGERASRRLAAELKARGIRIAK